MRLILTIILSTTVLAACAPASQDYIASEQFTPDGKMSDEESYQDEFVLNPEQEEEFYNKYFFILNYRFAQTTWKECSEEITGNYYGYNCSDRRRISVILKSFIENHIYSCIDEGLAAQGGGKVSELHIVHAGITGDRNHSPRSLHAENRAVDVKSFDMKLTNGSVKEFVFANTSHKPFFKAFRKCWGKVVNKYNGCPLYKGNSELTGSIGWEDKNHKRHMHLSVPYCVSGRYGSGYFQR